MDVQIQERDHQREAARLERSSNKSFYRRKVNGGYWRLVKYQFTTYDEATGRHRMRWTRYPYDK